MGYPYIKSPLESESDENLIAEKLLKTLDLSELLELTDIVGFFAFLGFAVLILL